jgi:hypothetical protein
MDSAAMSTKGFAMSYLPGGAATLRRARHGLIAVVAIGGIACGEESPTLVEPPTPGAIQLTTVTSGFFKDEGYDLLVNGQSQGTIGANDQRTIPGLDAATYQVELAGVAENCAVEAVSVPVASGVTAQVQLDVSCAHAAAVSYSLRASRDRPNLENGEITECTFGLCPSNSEWDMYVHFDSQTQPQAQVVEIAHLPGVAFGDLTEADFMGATFTTEVVAEALDPSSVVLLRTDQGNVYVLGNAVEDPLLMTLTFDAALIAEPAS